MDEANGEPGPAHAGPDAGEGLPAGRVPGQRDPIARPESAAPDPAAPPRPASADGSVTGSEPAPETAAAIETAAATAAEPAPRPAPSTDEPATSSASASAPLSTPPSASALPDAAPADTDRQPAEHPRTDPDPGPGATAGTEATAGTGAAADGATEPETSLSDAELVAEVRAGRDSAYEELYRRHADSVRRYARTCCRDAHTAEDLTGEVFARTLQAIRGGSGPQSSIRAYLLTTVRRVAASWGSTARREQLVEDFAVFSVSAAGSTATEKTADAGADVHAMHEAERSLAIRAFRTLPERWQTVLWHTAVEDESPSEIAPLLGLTPNATAVLAHRAREGLRQAYLQAHVSSTLTDTGDCARYADRLGAHARGGLRTRADRELNRHLKECERCTAASVELADLNSALKGLLPVAYIGWFAAAYAAKTAGIAAAGGAAAAAGGAAAAASGSGSSAGAGAAAAGEGLGVPVKIGIAAAVVAAAAATTFALTAGGGHPKPSAKPQAEPPVSAPAASVPPPPPAPKPQPSPPPPTSPAPTPTPTPKPAPKATPKPKPAPPRPTPEPTPPPTTPTPPPPPPPPPPTTTYQVNSLPVARPGRNASGPTIVRTGPGSWWWDRWGLSIGGTSYAHGITVHAPSTVTIELNRACLSYDARAGVDDLVGPLRGMAVRFSVSADTTRLWTSSPLHPGDPATPVHVPLAGRKTLTLTVTPTNGPLPLANLADWANPVITCA